MDEPDLTEEARRLFAGRVEFLLSAPSLDFLPGADFPEVAFAGRSNVGKSSLINAVTGRKAIARASVTPGRTQELNFFEVGAPTRLRLVDMPGYGFAKAPVKVVERWRRLVRDFLRGRQVLRIHDDEAGSLARSSGRERRCRRKLRLKPRQRIPMKAALPRQ